MGLAFPVCPGVSGLPSVRQASLFRGDSLMKREETPMAAPVFPPESALARLTPKLASLTSDVVFGDVWSRPELSKRDRSLITVSALIALNRPEQLKPHMRMALENGVTAEELAEQITHLAFYAGWPVAMTAVRILDEVLAPPAT
jgi:4-carboxymuconolactone decarboxylase